VGKIELYVATTAASGPGKGKKTPEPQDRRVVRGSDGRKEVETGRVGGGGSTRKGMGEKEGKGKVIKKVCQPNRLKRPLEGLISKEIVRVPRA